MSNRLSLVVFTLDQQRYALRLEAVERVVRAAEITTLPKTPDIILGIIDIQGEVIPVVNVRKRFRLPERELRLDDQFIVAHARTLKVALLVDSAHNVTELPEGEAAAPDGIMPGMEYVAGVVRTDDGLILIHDLSTFLSLEEERSLAGALAQGKL